MFFAVLFSWRGWRWSWICVFPDSSTVVFAWLTCELNFIPGYSTCDFQRDFLAIVHHIGSAIICTDCCSTAHPLGGGGGSEWVFVVRLGFHSISRHHKLDVYGARGTPNRRRDHSTTCSTIIMGGREYAAQDVRQTQ